MRHPPPLPRVAAPSPPQIQKLNHSAPVPFHGYTYAVASILTSLTLGLLIYGTAVWTM